MTADAPTDSNEPWSIARVLKWATTDFQQRGNASSRLDAELLLGHALELDRIGLIVQATRVLEARELAAFRALIQRRRRHEPIAYILGEREFYGLKFKVDRRVLIPRPDTECLVETALKRTLHWSLYGRALDLCTGSGCVALAFAKARPTWRVSGLDKSEEALSVARDNAQRLNAMRSVHFLQGDLLSAHPKERRYELITANPPYVPASELTQLTRDILDFEPHLALAGGEDGLELVRRLIDTAPPFLVDGGVLALELHFDQAARVTDLLRSRGFDAITSTRDYGGHERVVSATYAAGAR